MNNLSDAQRQALVLANLRIVDIILRQYPRLPKWEEDLRQDGYLGLAVAARHYDPDAGVTFPSYASWWVRKYIGQALHLYNSVVTVSARFDPVRLIIAPLDTVIGEEDGDVITLEEVLPSGENADGPLLNTEEQEDFARRLGRLNAREMQVLSLRYGLEDEAPMSSEQIALHLGLSRTYVWTVLEKSYKKMR